MSALLVCITCGAVFERRFSRQRYCPSHQPDIRSPTTKARRDGSGDYERNRLIVLAGNPVCWICGQAGADSADHVIPVALGGSHALSNLKAAHLSCNLRRGAELTNARKRAAPKPADRRA